LLPLRFLPAAPDCIISRAGGRVRHCSGGALRRAGNDPADCIRANL